jgi:uncharacterized membrane protein YedE/YeeE
MRFEGRHSAVLFLTYMETGIISLMHAQGILFIYLYYIPMGIGFGGRIVLMANLFGAYFRRTHTGGNADQRRKSEPGRINL